MTSASLLLIMEGHLHNQQSDYVVGQKTRIIELSDMCLSLPPRETIAPVFFPEVAFFATRLLLTSVQGRLRSDLPGLPPVELIP